MSTLALRRLRTLRQGYPYLLVALASLIGIWLGSERYGVRPNYNIDEELTAERLANAYAPAIGGLSSFYHLDNDAARERKRAELTAMFESDETIVGASVEVRPSNAPTHTDFDYSAVNISSESCVMRSLVASRSGLVRCHLGGAGGGRDVLKLTRPILQSEDVTVIAILQLDYRKVRQRFREP